MYVQSYPKYSEEPSYQVHQIRYKMFIVIWHQLIQNLFCFAGLLKKVLSMTT